ncbi:Rhodanese-like domain-containing protein [Kockiozyma suomiensis]|uniref:Rhodanese-like domain-containing protein n=1 Tax=Kockiozyma suomiensis TaxID=1337062 RepID=UPI003343F715
MATVKIVDKKTLRNWIIGVPRAISLTIIDVRDDDHIGGHIKGSRHHPTSSFANNLPFLFQELQEVSVVVFHCALSQQRGPSAASMYLRYAEMIHSVINQEVYVLKGGFVEWQEAFGNDKRLTEAYEESVWKGLS